MKRLLIALLIISLSIVKGIDTYSQVRNTKSTVFSKKQFEKILCYTKTQGWLFYPLAYCIIQ